MLISFDPNSNILKLDGVGVSLHCHHYNCGLIKTLEEIEGIDAKDIIISSAREEFYENFKNYISNNLKGKSEDEQLIVAVELYKFMGFGIIDISNLKEIGGKAYASSSYYVTGWLAKYGRRNEPVCYLTCGFLSGILSAIFKKSIGAYSVKEDRCMISGEEQCEFTIELRSSWQ